jgi:hypothetical protein
MATKKERLGGSAKPELIAGFTGETVWTSHADRAGRLLNSPHT